MAKAKANRFPSQSLPQCQPAQSRASDRRAWQFLGLSLGRHSAGHFLHQALERRNCSHRVAARLPFLTLFCVAVLTTLACGGQTSNTVVKSEQNPLQVIANPHATTNELIGALQALHYSRITNEGPQFWSAIANSTNFSHDHRERAALQLIARYFKSGMTIHQIAGLLNYPTWLVPEGTGFYGPGAPPPGGDPDDKWAHATIFFNQFPTATICFRFRTDVSAKWDDLFWCLEGEPRNAQLDNIKVIGIVSEERLPSRYFIRSYNSFGIPGYPGSFIVH